VVYSFWVYGKAAHPGGSLTGAKLFSTWQLIDKKRIQEVTQYFLQGHIPNELVFFHYTPSPKGYATSQLIQQGGD
jgi:hypothetical protein